MRLILAMTLALMAGAAPATPQGFGQIAIGATQAGITRIASDLPSIKMDANSGEFTLTWGGMPDKAVIRWKLMVSKGEIVVCANYALVGHSNRRLSREALEDIAIRMDRTVLVQDMTRFPEFSSVSKLIGGTASCVRSGVAAPKDPAAHDFSIGSSKTVYRD